MLITIKDVKDDTQMFVTFGVTNRQTDRPIPIADFAAKKYFSYQLTSQPPPPPAL